MYLERNLSKIGDYSYAYVIVKKNNPSLFSAISNYPDSWIDIYQKNAYQFTDPVVLYALNRFVPFLWNEDILIKLNMRLKKVFYIARKYNIVNGYTVVLHDHDNNLVMLSILIDNINEDRIEYEIKNNQDKLQMLLLYTHDKLLSLYENMNKKNNLNYKRELLTNRENEILYWSSMGKTYPEISAILGITIRTVKFHIGNTVKKLGVYNVKQAIRIGIELNIIDSVD